MGGEHHKANPDTSEEAMIVPTSEIEMVARAGAGRPRRWRDCHHKMVDRGSNLPTAGAKGRPMMSSGGNGIRCALRT